MLLQQALTLIIVMLKTCGAILTVHRVVIVAYRFCLNFAIYLLSFLFVFALDFSQSLLISFLLFLLLALRAIRHTNLAIVIDITFEVIALRFHLLPFSGDAIAEVLAVFIYIANFIFLRSASKKILSAMLLITLCEIQTGPSIDP